MPTLPRLQFAIGSGRDRAIIVVEAVLLLLLAVQCARLAWIVAVPAGPVGAPAQADNDAGAPTPALAQFGDLFFRGTDVIAAATAAFGLYGVRIDGADSAAILGKDGRQQADRLQDTVAPGVTLSKVAADHVLLRSSAGQSRLQMQAASPAIAATALPAGRATPAVADAGTTTEPARLLSQVGMRKQEGGGYALLANGHEALMRQAGLQPGDVLVAVDGRELDAEGLVELKQDIATRGQATLTVRRNGQTHTVIVGAGRR